MYVPLERQSTVLFHTAPSAAAVPMDRRGRNHGQIRSPRVIGLYGEEQSGSGLCSRALLLSALWGLEGCTAIPLGSLNKQLTLQIHNGIPKQKPSWKIICLGGQQSVLVFLCRNASPFCLYAQRSSAFEPIS